MAVAGDQQRQRVGDLPASRVRGAAELRKRLRRELQRVGTAGVSLYIDGPRGTVRMQFPGQDRPLSVAAKEALGMLQSLPDSAGLEATLEALGRISRI